LITQYAIGSELMVYFNVLGKEWINQKGEPVYFNSLDVWKIELIKNLQVDTGKTVMPNFNSTETSNGFDFDEDDLPF
jgi:hypothetical protein